MQELPKPFLEGTWYVKYLQPLTCSPGLRGPFTTQETAGQARGWCEKAEACWPGTAEVVEQEEGGDENESEQTV